MKFQPLVNGTITGVRFFKSAANTGTHAGSLWSIGGKLLARVTFAGETASGWQQMNFSSPVAVTAQTTYIVSYHAPAGHYSGDNHFFASAITNAANTLTASRDGASGPNGVYKYGSSPVFPSNGFLASNYYVDVVFTPAAASGTLTATPPSLAFPNTTAGQSQKLNVTITNTGSAPAAISAASISGAAFAIATAPSLPATLAVNGTAVFSVNFAPSAAGAASGTLTISSNASDSKLAIALSGTGVTPPSPTVSIASPANGATVSGAMTLSANASGGAGAIAVQFQVDGSNTGSAIASPPYSITIDTTRLTNGSHTFTAIASDAGGNHGSASVTVTVSNASAVLGDTAIEATLDNNADGQAEAFPVTAQTSGTLSALNVYLDASNGAHTVIAGLYSSNGHPATLLTSGAISNPQAGAWNSVAVAPASIISGTTYWIAILGLSGGVQFRDRANGGCSSETSQQTTLTSLPPAWSSGAAFPSCPASAYGTLSGAPPAPISVTISPATASVQAGQTAQFTAMINGAASSAVTWSVSGGTISATGLYTAGASAGTFSVTATSTADPTKSATATITVTVPPPSVSVTIAPASVTLAAGATQTFTATVGGTSNTAVSWKTNGGTITTAGLYTAPSAAGSFTVTATSAADTTKSATASVTVSSGPPPTGGTGWSDLPNTQLSQSGLCPNPSPGGIEGCSAVIRDWSGGIADTKHNRLILWGGGHDGYYGNEIYTLNLAASPVTLTRLDDPTLPSALGQQNGIEAIPPGTNNAPNSRHSYGSLAYIPSQDEFFVYGGGLAAVNGDGSTGTWTYSFTNGAWTRRPDLADGSVGYGQMADYDPNTNTVFLETGKGLYQYDVVANAYSAPLDTTPFDIYMTGVVDPVHKLFVMIGGGAGPGLGAWAIDIDPAHNHTAQNWTSQVTGCDALVQSASPGLAFDPTQNKIVGWPNFGNTVYIFDPAVKSCTTQTFAGGPPDSAVTGQPGTSWGTFGRFRYFPALGLFAVVNDWDVDAHTLRLSSGAPSPGPGTVTISPSSATLAEGGTQSFSANIPVTWAATGGAITPAGLYTAGSVAGNFSVTATSAADATQSASAAVAITAPPPTPVSVSISPTTATVPVGGTQPFNATVTGTANTAVTWSSTGGTISAVGVLTAPNSTGTVTVTATSVADITKSASATVNVVPGTSGGANNWTSRTSGVNIPGGQASVVGTQSFDTFPATNRQQYFQLYDPSSITTDCTIAADGCSLKFSVLKGYQQGEPGWLNWNFSPDLSKTFGNGQEFYLQYRYRIDPGMLNGANFPNSEGFKAHIITEGDTASVQAGDCGNSPGELVVQQDGVGSAFPILYHNCGFSGGTFNFMVSGYQPVQLGGITGTNFLDQNIAGCPHYDGRGIPATDPTCFNYGANEWMTVQVHVKVGTFNNPNSTIELWLAHQGQAAELVVNASDAALVNDGSGGASGRYGKIALLPYQTNMSGSLVDTAVWYDDLMVATRRIPDADAATPNAPDSLNVAGASPHGVTVIWRVNSQNGTAQDDTGFLVERCTGDGAACFPNPQSGFAQIGTTAAGASSFADTAAVSGTTYTYRVRARNAAGNSGYAASQCFNAAGVNCGGTIMAP